MKKIISLVLALCMVLTIGIVFADENDGGAASTPTGNLTLDSGLQITNLDQGDQVTLYQVLGWDQYWKAISPYAGSDTAHLSQADVDKIVGQDHETKQLITEGAGLSQTYIDKIVSITPGTAVNGPVTIGADGTYSYSTTVAGMYYAIVTPKNAAKIYKPIFVSVDYKQLDPDSSAVAVTAAKYELIEINKEATDQTNNQDATVTYENGANSYNTVGIGDTVTFKIDTTIPKFPASFTSPVFNVSDTLNGLTLKHADGDIKVYAGDIKEENLLAGTQYTIDPVSDSGFTVKFKSEYIKGLTAAQPIHVVYQGIVNDAASYNVNEKENTATVNFSNNPDDSTGANELKDETRHYTFSINGLVTGERHGTDLIKVGVDKEGNEITRTYQLPNTLWAGSLQGATFELYLADQKTVCRTGLVSGENGAIEINGLDAGVYYLKELSAPAGFVKYDGWVKVEIKAFFKNQHVNASEKTVKIDEKNVVVTVPAYDYAILDRYEIWIENQKTSTYTMKNEEEIDPDGIDDDQIAAGSSEGKPAGGMLGKVPNTEGVELPSTGGIGTTIFYILGGLLVVGAAVILIARRKAQD